MRLIPRVRWHIEGRPERPLDDRLLPLLAAIATGGSIRAATQAVGMSYRAAWGLLAREARLLDAELVVLERGRGAWLAPAGAAIVAADSRARRRTPRLLEPLSIDLTIATGRIPAPTPMLRLSASHDLALAALRDALAGERSLALELVSKGSVEAVQDFGLGRADLAGFHMPLPRSSRHWAPFERWLRPERDRLIRFADREQGLIVAPGNPARVHGIADVARRGLRFVNRQTGSGTRLLVDALLARDRLAPRMIRGYSTEELTHSAVADAVAAGRADAGFGIRAAALERGLAFIPLALERYQLAVRAAALETLAVRRLVAALKGEIFARIATTLTGYHVERAGQIDGIRQYAEGRRPPPVPSAFGLTAENQGYQAAGSSAFQRVHRPVPRTPGRRHCRSSPGRQPVAKCTRNPDAARLHVGTVDRVRRRGHARAARHRAGNAPERARPRR